MEMGTRTASPENERLLRVRDEIGFERLGLMASQTWYEDPRSVLFKLARYKFVSKLLQGAENVLEVGCGDAFYSRLVQQAVSSLTVSDHDPLLLQDAIDRSPDRWRPNTLVFNPLEERLRPTFEAVYLLDVFEHIPPQSTAQFMTGVCSALKQSGRLIVGIPSRESQLYASEISKEGHVNCLSGDELVDVLSDYAQNIMLFSMNDEVVHTGFAPMAHYLFAVGSKNH